jgi:hypothetical protein
MAPKYIENTEKASFAEIRTSSIGVYVIDCKMQANRILLQLGQMMAVIQNTYSELYIGIQKSSGKLYQLAKGERITWEIYTESEMDN